MIKGVGNYFAKTNYDDEYWKLPDQLKAIYDSSPTVRQYVGQLKRDRVIPLANALQIYQQEIGPAKRLASLRQHVGPERNPGKLYKAQFAPGNAGMGTAAGSTPGWKRYHA